MSDAGEILRFENISRSFFGVSALRNVTFTARQGKTLGLVGENGAGKSTLMNLLGGVLRPDSGTMLLAGQPHAPTSPRDAERAGIAFIHQELNLFPNLTIAENIFIRRFPRRAAWNPFIRWKEMRERTRELLKELSLDHHPDTPVERLSAGERQLVEIAKALNIQARLIIFDEPTTSLTARETDRLFKIMRSLRERGVSMFYISHNLEHVLSLCDDIVVLRDGEVVGSGPREHFTIGKMVSQMVGREISQFFPPPIAAPRAERVLEVRGVSQPNVARDISLEIRAGETVGISGLMGSGRSELARILFGLDPLARGEILLDGQPITHLTSAERIRRGLAFLTEDRRSEGLCMDASIADNSILVALRQFARTATGRLDARAASAAVRGTREEVKLTAKASDDQPVRTLSGGNQQKVVFAKWLMNQPKLLILDEPTRGVDVGAKYEIYRLIRELTARGAGVLMISSEIEELLGMCDRILVMSQGAIRRSFDSAEFNREQILQAAIHKQEAHERG
ncbi:MAG TPA: sugar ABC transporter ATP-binding protein [Methylomirabilota bacterium]|nr:sugar ABC transporter ATP-binding protein [Methylomirabilota bacterium]